jgi:hypothetical protein
MMYKTTQVASCQRQSLPSLHPKPMIGLARHPWHSISKSTVPGQIRNTHRRYNAASGSLDGPDDFNFSESSFPPPPPPATTQEPKDDVAKLIYHTGKFILYVTSA